MVQAQQIVNEPPASDQHQQYAPQTQHNNVIGFGSSAMGSLFGIARDWLADKRNEKSVQKAQDFATKSANVAFQREQASVASARKYNSESSQVTRFIEAGLSPALMYSQMSPTTAQSAQASAAQTVQPMASEINKSPGLLEAFQLFLQSQGLGSTMALQSAQARNFDASTTTSQINNETQNARNLQEIQTSIAQMESLLASKSLSEAQRGRINAMLQKELDLLDEQIGLTGAQQGQANASANLSNAQAGAVPSQVALNRANARNANASADFTAGAQTKLAESSAGLNEQNRKKSKQETENMSSGQSVAFQWLTNHGYDDSEAEDLAPIVVRMFEQSGNKIIGDVSSSLTSWLSASNILPAINEWRRTNAIKNMNRQESAEKDRIEAIQGKNIEKDGEEARKFYYNLTGTNKDLFDQYLEEFSKEYYDHGWNVQDPAVKDTIWKQAYDKYISYHKQKADQKNSANGHSRWHNWFTH